MGVAVIATVSASAMMKKTMTTKTVVVPFPNSAAILAVMTIARTTTKIPVSAERSSLGLFSCLYFALRSPCLIAVITTLSSTVV